MLNIADNVQSGYTNTSKNIMSSFFVGQCSITDTYSTDTHLPVTFPGQYG